MLAIRPVIPADGPALVPLLHQLGYAWEGPAVTQNLARLLATGDDPVLVAERDGTPVGLVALHMMHTLHWSYRIARITALVVEENERGTGLGRLLIDAAEELAAAGGCEALELTSGMHRPAAHAFYRRLGFQDQALRFYRQIEGAALEHPLRGK
ncbi:GNAT family N-acetyltransferase [Rhodovarius lipocyclicus]|uniref:GNAT family N-acetyltransferase n=1 Tax=Rhodovarius lipocyclicus TaxID=268410 RepID=UPI00135C2B55|nr:GNAT family N-acetyltransferase [Rhodovarius lipocyclicus]